MALVKIFHHSGNGNLSLFMSIFLVTAILVEGSKEHVFSANVELSQHGAMKAVVSSNEITGWKPGVRTAPCCAVSLDTSMSFRGGSDDEDDEEEEFSGEEEEDDEEEAGANTGADVKDKIIQVSTRVVIFVGKASMNTAKSAAKAIQRAIQAGVQGEEDRDLEEEEPETTFTKVVRMVKRMVHAAFNPPNDDDAISQSALSKATIKSEDDDNVDEDPSEEYIPIQRSDLGTFFAKAYGVADDRGEEGPPMLGGTLTDALREARSQARLLLVLVPSSRPNKRKQTADQVAVESILSMEVSQMANKRARKSGEATGSFLFWGAKAGSSEATTAIKRLKAKPPASSTKGGKPPTLLVVYPDEKADSFGRPQLVPRLLAQHHCSPPPEPSLMAAWLNALRKRHAKQYSVMQTALKEVQYFKERKEGYKESVHADIKRREEERLEEEKQKAKEEEEQAKREAILERRKELELSLPEEFEGTTAKTIALRFADGRSGQRKFSPETPVRTIFNWVDAMFEIEREDVILTTMKGDISFSWDDDSDSLEQTLEEAGIGRNTGLRVTIQKKEMESAAATPDDGA